jgi:ferredoxin-type protein NapH
MMNRYLIARRITQITILFLYFAANAWGWNILAGNLSTSVLFETIPLSDPFAVIQILATGAVVTGDILIGAIVILLFYSVVGGRAFCSWVCPVNMITDLAAWLRRKLKIERVTWISRKVRYFVFVLTIVLSFVFGLAAFEFISPIGIFTRGVIFGFGMGIGLLIAIFIFDLFVVKNGWCGHICPLGAFYSMISRWSIFRVFYDKDKCTMCMECKNVCPEKDVLHMVGHRSEFITLGECTLCGRCIDVCNDNALYFKFRRSGKNEEKN